ncbi:MAG: OsmC family protein [Planctomycetota bacterium]
MSGEVRVSGVENNWFQQVIKARSHELIADEPLDFGGSNLGPTPYELLLSALGSCIAITVRMYAKKKEWPLLDVIVELKHQRIHAKDCEECEEKDGYIDVIDKRVEFVGELSSEQYARLTEIAGRCPVHRTLEGTIKIRQVET